MLTCAHSLTCVSRGCAEIESSVLALVLRLTDAGEREHAQPADCPIGLQAPSFRHQEKAGFIPANREEMVAGRMGQRSAASRGRGCADHGDRAAWAVEMGERSHVVVAVKHELRTRPAEHFLEALGI